MIGRPSPVKGVAVIVLVLVAMTMPGCFTYGVWTAEEQVGEDEQGQPIVGPAFRPWQSLLLTPLTLLLDLATSPIQAFFNGDDDDDGRSARRTDDDDDQPWIRITMADDDDC